jgi:HlyD family secretion protein
MKFVVPLLLSGVTLAIGACGGSNDGQARASGYVEATEVRVAAEVGGRVLEMLADEGRRVAAGDVLARLDTADIDLARRRASAERDQAAAQLRLVRSGARGEEVRQASAQADSARADVTAMDAEVQAAREDLRRFDALLAANAGSRKQRDDAAQTRSSPGSEPVRAATRSPPPRPASKRSRHRSRRSTRVLPTPL